MDNNLTPQEQPKGAPQQPQSTVVQPVQQPVGQEPSKTLSIVGLVLAIVANIIGLIISIIAFVQFKKRGLKNPIALAGIIVGAVTTLTSLLFSIFVGAQILSGDLLRDAEPRSIANTPVSVAGNTVDSACFSFDLPAGYIINPEASTCQVELRLDNGTDTGVALTSIQVAAQNGGDTTEDFLATLEEAGATDFQTVTIDGIESTKAEVVNGFGLPQIVYFIPDTSGKFLASNGAVTSYIIFAPGGDEEVVSVVEGIVNSFQLK